MPIPCQLAHAVRTDGSLASGGRQGTRNTLIGIEFDAIRIRGSEQRRQIEQEGFMPIDDGAFVVVRADLWRPAGHKLPGSRLWPYQPDAQASGPAGSRAASASVPRLARLVWPGSAVTVSMRSLGTDQSLDKFPPAGDLSRRHEKVAVVTLAPIIQAPAVST